MDDDAQRTEAGGMDGTSHLSGMERVSDEGVASSGESTDSSLSANDPAGTSGAANITGTNNRRAHVADAAPASDTSFEALRRKLVAHAQRMLGSRAEAEDVVQDAWLKWHGASAADVRSPDAWLTTVTTRLAIDRLRRLRIERASHASGKLPQAWLADALAPAADEPAAHASDMSYGVMLLLERLKPDERAAFVLHEALDCDYAEIAKILAKTPPNCRQIVHRAKERLRRAGAPSKAADPAEHARLVDRLRAAIDAQDRGELVRLFSVSVRIEGGEEGRDESTSTQATSASAGSMYSAAASQAFSLSAIRRLLRQIADQPPSWTRCGAVPVDIDA
jgi:RNA polymerase sigma factor (sigma-70 family)